MTNRNAGTIDEVLDDLGMSRNRSVYRYGRDGESGYIAVADNGVAIASNSTWVRMRIAWKFVQFVASALFSGATATGMALGRSAKVRGGADGRDTRW